MIYTELTKKAMRIAFDAHKKQKDKSGLPYIYHPYHLAEQMDNEISICVALLHDVVEDTRLSFRNLEAQGMPPMVIETLKLLTHDKSVPYLDYVRKIKKSGNPVAIAVKLADLQHNSDTKRLNTNGRWVDGAYIESIDPKTSERVARYRTAISILQSKKEENVVYIEREEGTGIACYKLSVGTSAYYSSQNLAAFPRSFTDPIQTYDLINNKTFTTTKDPSYRDITIVPGLKLKYPVFDGKDNEMIANMTVTIESGPFGSSSFEYCIFDENNGNPRVYIDTTSNEPIEPAVLECLPINDITTSIYPDEAFVYDSRSIVEKRFIVSIHEKHLRWLHHVFHAFILRHSV